MIKETTYLYYFSALLDGKKDVCVKVVNELLEQKTPLKEIYTGLFQRSLYRIGNLWETDRITIATEHSATKITEMLIGMLYQKVAEQKKIGKSIIITCVDKEFHEIGPKIISDFFELHGWDSTFLGANTPKNDIIEMIKEKKPDLVGLSNNFYINFIRLLKMVDAIKREVPDQRIVIGGQSPGNSDPGLLNKYDNVEYIESLDKLESFINDFK